MMKKKNIAAIILALIIFLGGCSIPASAAQSAKANKSPSSASKTENLIKLLLESDIKFFEYYSKYPDPLNQIIKDGKDGTLDTVAPDAAAISNRATYIISNIQTMINPSNKQFGKIARLSVTGTSDKQWPQIIDIDMVRFSYPTAYEDDPEVNQGELLIAPLWLLRDAYGNLHVICTLTNITGSTISFYGLEQVEIQDNGKVVAKGNPAVLNEPMIFSSLPLEQSHYTKNTLINGYPTGNFVDIIFEPGTYDDSIKVSDLQDISISYYMVTDPAV